MKILIADDHAVVRRGLRELLEERFPQAQFAEAGNATQALELVAREPWDIVITDVTMPGRSGLELVKEIKTLHPRVPVLLLSVHPEDQFAVRALRAGAAGYITKDSADRLLVEAVEKALAGGTYVSRALAETLAAGLQADAAAAPHELLSDREDEVFRLIAAGKQVKEIAAELRLSVKTISTHRAHILEKMRLKTNAELVRYAIAHGISR